MFDSLQQRLVTIETNTTIFMADRPLCRGEEIEQEWNTEGGKVGKVGKGERRKGNAKGRKKGRTSGRKKDSARGRSRERKREWNMKLLKIYDYLDCIVRVRFALIIKTSFHVA